MMYLKSTPFCVQMTMFKTEINTYDSQNITSN